MSTYKFLTLVFNLRTSSSRLRTPNFRLLTPVFQLSTMAFLVAFLQIVSLNASQSQSLNDYLEIAAENNPEVKAYFNEYLAAMEKIPQVGALPDPELTIGFFFKPMDRFMGKQQADIQLMQMFPWFGMLGTRKDEASNMALAKYKVFEDVKNKLFFQVKNTSYEMYQLETEIRIMEENLEMVKTYERLALTRFQSPATGASSGNMRGSGTTGGNSGTSAASSMGGM